MRRHGYAHPLGDGWRGIHDINPGELSRERIVVLLEKVDPKSNLAVVPHGTPKRVALLRPGFLFTRKTSLSMGPAYPPAVGRAGRGYSSVR